MACVKFHTFPSALAFVPLIAARAEVLPRGVEDEILDVGRGRVGGHGVHQTTHQSLLFSEVLGIHVVFVRLIALILKEGWRGREWNRYVKKSALRLRIQRQQRRNQQRRRNNISRRKNTK